LFWLRGVVFCSPGLFLSVGGRVDGFPRVGTPGLGRRESRVSGPRDSAGGSRGSRDPGTRPGGSRGSRDPGTRPRGSRGSRDPGTRPAGVEGLGTPGLRPAGVARESGVPRAAFATEPLNPALGAGSSRCLTGLGGSGAGWRSTPHAPILRPGDGCGMGKW
jgi:hypothetical protein